MGKRSLTGRTNEEWVSALRDPHSDEAIRDLRSILFRGLTAGFNGGRSLGMDALEDITQDALVKVIGKLNTFEGRGRFTTWAMKIAVNLALTELQHRRFRDYSLDRLIESKRPGFVPHELSDPLPGPEVLAVQQTFLTILKRAIARELTETQRIVFTAVYINKIPLGEIARKMGKEKNALYKLLHHARLRLRDAIFREGLNAEEVGNTFRKLRNLVDVIMTSRSQEIGCDEACEHLGQYTDQVVEGKSTPETLPQVQLHLFHCPGCGEEFEILLEAIRATG